MQGCLVDALQFSHPACEKSNKADITADLILPKLFSEGSGRLDKIWRLSYLFSEFIPIISEQCNFIKLLQHRWYEDLRDTCGQMTFVFCSSPLLQV